MLNMSIAGHTSWFAYDMFFIMSHSGQSVYDPNLLRPNPNPQKPVTCSQVGSIIDTPNFIQWESHFRLWLRI